MENYYYIITRQEIIDGSVVDTAVGYVTSEEDAHTINLKYDSTFISWINDNRYQLVLEMITVESYFDSNPPCYNAYCKTTCIEGMGLLEITDISNY